MPKSMHPNLRFKVNGYVRRVLAIGWDPVLNVSDDGMSATIRAINPNNRHIQVEIEWYINPRTNAPCFRQSLVEYTSLDHKIGSLRETLQFMKDTA